MADMGKSLDQALQTIRQANLAHPDGELLECFLQESIDPEQAACYILQQCAVDTSDIGLEVFLSKWKRLIAAFMHEGLPRAPSDEIIANVTTRDGGKCFITGLKGSFLDPLIVTPILLPLNIQLDKHLREILEIFIGTDLRDWILSDAVSLDAYRNFWLVRRSAAKTFLQGFFQIQFAEGSEYEVGVVEIGGPAWPSIINEIPLLRFGHLMGHPSPLIEGPDFDALQILSRFAKPIRWTLVAEEILKKQQHQQAVPKSPLSCSRGRISDFAATVFFTTWRRLVPAFVRIRVYRGLAWLGARWYGPSSSMKVQQLPFGMYLKTTGIYWHQGLANEYGALQLIRRHTNIPVPRPLDIVSSSEDSYLLTSTLPGVRLGMCLDSLSDSQVETLVQDLRECFAQLRAIPKDVAPKYAITNSLGNACYDYRILAGLKYDESRGDTVGPFVDEHEFNNLLRAKPLPNVHHTSTEHRIVFTHADLNMRNVLVQQHNGRLSGIVDWENSGWYPEYWEYTKAHYITKLNRRWLAIVDQLFNQRGNYDRELEIERQLWDYCF